MIRELGKIFIQYINTAKQYQSQYGIACLNFALNEPKILQLKALNICAVNLTNFLPIIPNEMSSTGTNLMVAQISHKMVIRLQLDMLIF